MIDLSFFKSIPEYQEEIALRARKRRKEAGLSQEALARKSDVSLGSIKRFERSGEISLKSLVKLAFALDQKEGLDALFNQKKYRSIEEIIREQKNS